MFIVKMRKTKKEKSLQNRLIIHFFIQMVLQVSLIYFSYIGSMFLLLFNLFCYLNAFFIFYIGYGLGWEYKRIQMEEEG